MNAEWWRYVRAEETICFMVYEEANMQDKLIVKN